MIDTDDFLEHYGVKGMKWGVRRAQKKAAKADKKWEGNIRSLSGAIQVHNAVANRANNGGLDKLNNNPKYKGKVRLDSYGRPQNAVSKQYLKDYEKLNEKWTREAITEVHGTSPSGKMKASLDTSSPGGWRVKVTNLEIEHATTALPDMVFACDHDENGYITKQTQISEELQQTSLTPYEFLAHYGIKGMRWGVRKKNQSKASTDGKEANRILEKQKAQGIRGLTNHELRVINTRRELETKFEKQNPKPPTIASHGRKFAKEIATAAGIGSTAALFQYVQSGKAQEHASKGLQFIKNNPYLKLGVRALPENEQLKLF